MPLRLIQWATGNVGRRAGRAIIEHPHLERVGLHAFSSDKMGQDAGELCGTPETGIRATDDADALLALTLAGLCDRIHLVTREGLDLPLCESDLVRPT